MRILITGASGALGYYLTNYLAKGEKRPTVTGTYFSRPVRFEQADSLPLNFAVESQCHEIMGLLSPTHVIHTGAMTHTGECEKAPGDAERINVQGTCNLIEAAGKLARRPHFVHISTDLVFDGAKGNYCESDSPNPIQAYGRSKLRAEDAVRSYPGRWTVLRSALIFAPPMPMRKTFLDWMIAGIKAREGFLFDDEFRTPIFVRDLCGLIDRICTQGAAGIYHCGGPNRLSRYEFGLLVATAFALPNKNVRKKSLGSVKVDAPRPPDVSLSIGKATRELNYSPISCMDALQDIAKVLRPKA